MDSPLSPEQASDDDLTHQTDLYSFGVVMYEVLAGRPPFRARGFSGLLNKILNEDPPDLKEFRPEVSDELAAIVYRAMAKPLDKRYQTGAEIATELAVIMDNLKYPTRSRQELSSEQKFELARQLEFFNDFSDAEVEEVLEVALWETFSDGERIMAEGDLEESFSIILSGDVSIRVGEKPIASLTKGDCVGEMGYLAEDKRTASVVAAGDVSLLKIDLALIEWASIPCQMRFNKAFMRVLINRLAHTSRKLAQFV